MDNGAKCSGTNIFDILRDVKWYDSKFKVTIHMKGVTLGTLIVPAPQGFLRVQDNTSIGYLDILCFILCIFHILCYQIEISFNQAHIPRNSQDKL